MSPVVFSQSESQLQKLLQRFPVADTNGDGKLTAEEARAFMASRSRGGKGQGPPMEFHVDPGWSKDRFPGNAVCYMTPVEIQALYRKVYPKGPWARGPIGPAPGGPGAALIVVPNS